MSRFCCCGTDCDEISFIFNDSASENGKIIIDEFLPHENVLMSFLFVWADGAGSAHANIGGLVLQRSSNTTFTRVTPPVVNVNMTASATIEQISSSGRNTNYRLQTLTLDDNGTTITWTNAETDINLPGRYRQSGGADCVTSAISDIGVYSAIITEDTTGTITLENGANNGLWDGEWSMAGFYSDGVGRDGYNLTPGWSGGRTINISGTLVPVSVVFRPGADESYDVGHNLAGSRFWLEKRKYSIFVDRQGLGYPDGEWRNINESSPAVNLFIPTNNYEPTVTGKVGDWTVNIPS